MVQSTLPNYLSHLDNCCQPEPDGIKVMGNDTGEPGTGLLNKEAIRLQVYRVLYDQGKYYKYEKKLLSVLALFSANQARSGTILGLLLQRQRRRLGLETRLYFYTFAFP
ncbi:hypothetical protein [Rufibacter aurantiacus]|uniref:hypothetical protein n=1 Tax=Rufibacter aurantiacus TaxID=2817374 RepID=UPI001B315243|nr:hypothetical protein [Rufibacter aurantiacus]